MLEKCHHMILPRLSLTQFRTGTDGRAKNMCNAMSTNVNKQAFEWRGLMLNDSTMMAGVTPPKALKKLYSTNRKMSE